MDGPGSFREGLPVYVVQAGGWPGLRCAVQCMAGWRTSLIGIKSLLAVHYGKSMANMAVARNLSRAVGVGSSFIHYKGIQTLIRLAVSDDPAYENSRSNRANHSNGHQHSHCNREIRIKQTIFRSCFNRGLPVPCRAEIPWQPHFFSTRLSSRGRKRCLLSFAIRVHKTVIPGGHRNGHETR